MSFSPIECCALFIPRIDRVLRSKVTLTKIIVSKLGLTSEKKTKVNTPENRGGLESCARRRRLVSHLLSGVDTKQYRSLTLRAAHLAMDRVDLGICVKKQARRMQQPREVDMQRLKRLVRYWMGQRRVVQRFETLLTRDG